MSGFGGGYGDDEEYRPGEYYPEGHRFHNRHHHHHREGEEGYVPPQDFSGGYQQPGGYPVGVDFQAGGYPGGGFQGDFQGGQGQFGGGAQFVGPQYGGQQYGGQQFGGGGGGQFGQPRRQFYIVSEMNQKVVDIERANKAAETKINMWDRNNPPAENQLWFLDDQGFIRSALNDMSFTNHANDHQLKMTMASGDPRSQWRLEGNRITNQVGDALDIKGKSNHNGAELISYQYQDHQNQHWRFDYI